MKVLRRVRWIVMLVAVMLAPWMSTAGAAPGDQPLVVGVTEVPPFVMRTPDGEWRGISIELWGRAADNLGYEYEIRPMAFGALLDAVAAGSVDVAVGALTMTAERERRFDFTHPFFSTGLAIAVPAEQGSGWFGVLRRFLSWQFLSVVLALAGLLLLVGFVVWLLERRVNPDEFGGHGARGIGASFWWAAVTMTTVGYGDKSPRSLGGRLVGIVWMFAALIIVSAFTAAMTTALTISNLDRAIQGPGDLRNVTVATVAETSSEAYLRRKRIDYRAFPDLTAAVEAVAVGGMDAVVYDDPLLRYRAGELAGPGVEILPGVFAEEDYAFALPSGSPLREPLSTQLLALTTGDAWRDLRYTYLGSIPGE